jgi:putative Mg2+ transporter-C (MgtC) family protein
MSDWWQTMDWKFELVMAGRAVLAALLGGALGIERQLLGREAGVRTYAAVSLGSCVFALVSLHALPTPSPVIAAGMVTGVGFLGAGMILREGGHVVGLTTAATAWATAAVGMLVGFGMYLLAAVCSALLLGILLAHHLPVFRRWRDAHLERNGPDGRRR